ncbi:sigma 54-interacting transcriptional regulator [Myxococcota bacterium]|nr:sigma 54-interacting transcriptional regulator [Myxococcota bacterium]
MRTLDARFGESPLDCPLTLDPSPEPFPEIIGQSPGMRRLKAALHELARLEVAVLVRGESGAGKELAAAALHRGSARARRAYIAVNCAALPRELLESELFGCEPGAFTGARRRDGYVARADRGTLFLDEIGELSLSAQAVLLRVLETGEYTPVGGERARRADFRLICATHRDLRQMVRAGTFRLDLYHRICGLVVDVPPLRARTEDLPLLCRAFLGPGGPTLTRAALARLSAHPWPGNVRELKNVLARAVARRRRADEYDLIEAEHVVFDAWSTDDPAESPASPLVDPFPAPSSRPGTARSVRAALGRLVRDEVERHEGNVRAAARALGISHTTVYRHLRAFEGPLASPAGQ